MAVVRDAIDLTEGRSGCTCDVCREGRLHIPTVTTGHDAIPTRNARSMSILSRHENQLVHHVIAGDKRRTGSCPSEARRHDSLRYQAEAERSAFNFASLQMFALSDINILPASAKGSELPMIRKSEVILAPPRDLLARAFIDILAREAGDIAKPLLRSGRPDDPIEQLLDDMSPTDAEASRISIRPDLAAAAILTARAIEGERALVRELRRGSPVVIIGTHVPDLVPLVRDVVKTCCFSPDTSVVESRMFAGSSRTAVIFPRDGTDKDHKPDKGNDAVADALHLRNPIIGIAADPRRHLPRDLLRAAEYRLSISQLDADAIALVIEAVTGIPLGTAIDPELVRAVEVSDLQLALRRDRSPDECLARLDEIVRSRCSFDGDGPRLEDLAGYGEAKQWGLDLAADIAAYRKGLLEWNQIDNPAALVAGPPGVGKTQYALALARSAGVPIVATSVADWNAANYLSGTLQAMRNAFAQARRLAPCVLFIDELDGISDRTTLRGEYVEYWTQIVNLLLELLAGVEERPGVVVLGATNHIDKIDAAIRRAGRLDRTITIEKPGVEDLDSIFRFHLKDALPGADLMPAALEARGGTGADVEAWVRRAKGKARRNRRELSIDDLLEAIRGGRKPLPRELRRLAAIHESGHVLVGEALKMFALKAVSVYDAGGMTTVHLKIEYTQTLRGLESLMTALLAGRAAEEIVFGRDCVTAGSGDDEKSDLARATQIAIDIEAKLGMGMFGPVHLPEHTVAFLMHNTEMIVLIKKRLDRCLEQARDILSKNRSAHLAIADALEERGYLDAAEVEALLNQFPLVVAAPSITPQSQADILSADPRKAPAEKV